MATSATSNLGLLYPDKESLVRWPTLNTFNSDFIDNLTGNVGLHSYSPVLSNNDGKVLNVGSTGHIEGWWYRIFDMVFTWGRLLFDGTGIDFGASGDFWRITLPVAINGLSAGSSGAVAEGDSLGSSTLFRSPFSTARQTAVSYVRSSNQIALATENGAGNSLVGRDSPWTWEAGERIAWCAAYRGSFS